MIKNNFLHKKLKNKSWDNRTKWISKKGKNSLVSPHKVLNSLEKPKDWNSIAENCSNNPKHEHFEKDPKEILNIWKTKGKKGASKGKLLDEYITKRLMGKAVSKIKDIENKAQQFDDLYNTVLKKLSTYVGSEIWLNSKELGIIARLDSLFTINDKNDKRVLVCDWKNTESISYKKFGKLLGPANFLYDNEITKFTLQIHFYKYILEEYGIFEDIFCHIYQFSDLENKWKKHDPIFKYDRKFIEEIVKWKRKN